MKVRVHVSIDNELFFRCKADAEEMRRSLSSYVALVLEQRHGLLTVNLPPPVVTKLPMSLSGRKRGMTDDPFEVE